MIRVLIADDEAMIRGGIRAILSTDAEIDVVAEAGNGREAIDLAQRHRPDVALLDIRMPVLDGLTAAREIAVTVPATKVIILTTFGEDDYVSRALSDGAAGFLLKASDPRELIAGIHAVADGAAYLSPTIAQRVIGHYRGGGQAHAARARALIERLSSREREVLALLGAGESNSDIARSLHLVEGTVKGHVSAILIKLDLRNRVQAAIVAYEANLTDEHRSTPPTA